MSKLPLYLTFMLMRSLVESKPTFSYNSKDFLINEQPFQIRSGELHYSRIPPKYWKHRIQMAKASGMNTIGIYVMWNFHEMKEGKFDFSSPERDLDRFIRLVQEEGMYILLRPGPYVCAEWDFGGLPAWLLSYEGIKVRCMDETYMKFVKRYIEKISDIIRKHQITQGGPILMLQLENEYGYYSNDKDYLNRLKELWVSNKIDINFFTCDIPTVEDLTLGSVEGAIIGLNPGLQEIAYGTARMFNSNAPAFSSETYAGWFTHFGDNEWGSKPIDGFLNGLRFLMDNRKSFNLYVIHGGTNFGFWAGANEEYIPDVTSYDYDAPINENGGPTPKYFAMRDLIQTYLSESLPEIPETPRLITIDTFKIESYASLWDNLPEPIKVAQPKPMEYFDQQFGLILYTTKVKVDNEVKYTLNVKEPHDYAQVYCNERFIGQLDRQAGKLSLPVPKLNQKENKIEIMVEAMGRINFGEGLIDRKGITDRVTLNSKILAGWNVYNLPLDEDYIVNLNPLQLNQLPKKYGMFYKGEFNLVEVGDTYLDLSAMVKGVVWVNGNNIGRHWNIGPQFRLFCPSNFLKEGRNEIIVLDMLMIKRFSEIRGFKTLNPESTKEDMYQEEEL